MCLFLQTQNFQQVTAALVTDMHASSTAANASLSFIRRDLQAQSQSLAQSLSALSKLQAVQYEVEAAVQAGLLEVKAVGVISTGLQQSMDKSLNMTVRDTSVWAETADWQALGFCWSGDNPSLRLSSPWFSWQVQHLMQHMGLLVLLCFHLTTSKAASLVLWQTTTPICTTQQQFQPQERLTTRVCGVWPASNAGRHQVTCAKHLPWLLLLADCSEWPSGAAAARLQ